MNSRWILSHPPERISASPPGAPRGTEQQQKRDIRHRIRQRIGRMGHHDPARLRRIEIDMIVAGGKTSDDLHAPGQPPKRLARHLLRPRD